MLYIYMYILYHIILCYIISYHIILYYVYMYIHIHTLRWIDSRLSTVPMDLTHDTLIISQCNDWCYPLSNSHITNYGKAPFLMGKLPISMAIFNSYVKLPGGIFH